jgi:hypothetical protein
MAMWNALPEDSRRSLSQLFFSQYARPLPDAVLASGARAFFDNEKVPAAAKKALHEAVKKKAIEIAGSMNQQQAEKVVDEAFKEIAADAVRDRAEEIIAKMDDGGIIDAALPGIGETIGRLTEQYFLRTQQGQARITGLIDSACEKAAGNLVAIVESELQSAAEPLISARSKSIIRKETAANGRRKKN